MPSWKKLVVSGSDARVATLFTSGHLTSSGNISGSLTGSFRKIVTDDLIEATASRAISASRADTVISASYADSSSKVRLTPTGLIGGQFNVMLTPVIGSSIEDVEFIEGKIGGRSSGEGGRLYFSPSTRTLSADNFAGTASLSSKIRARIIGGSYTASVDVADKAFPIGILKSDLSTISSSNDVAKGLYGGDKHTGVSWQFKSQTISGSSISTASFATYRGGSVIVSGDVTAANLTADSSSFSSRITSLAADSSSFAQRITNLKSDSGSFSTRITDDSGSFSTRTTNLESKVGQSLNTTDSPRFSGINVDGDLTARRLIVSSSVSVITSSFSSGSTIFGDDILDTHRFSGSVSISGSIMSNGLPVVSSSAQIADAISGSFTSISKSFADVRTLHSQSFQNRISQVESGVGDGGSFSGTNTGDVTLGGLYDYLSLSNQQINLGQIELNTDVTGSLGAIHLKGSTAASAISGAFSGASSSISTRLTAEEANVDALQADSASFSSRVTSVEASTGGQDLSTSASPSFQSMSLTGSLKISGSEQATTIHANNIQNGYPTSNNWGENLEGSYFNNFTNETHVSEILRFIAGAMSHSLNVADAAPNTKFLNSVSTTYTGTTTDSKNTLFNGVLGSSYQTAKLSAHWTSSAAINMSTTGSYREVQNYLISKGFMVAGDRGTFGNDTGTNPFTDGYGTNIPTNISRNNQFDSFALTVTSNAGGSTNFNSSADAQLFGLGTLSSGNANEYAVRVIASQSFSDNQADPTPDASSTFHKKEVVNYTQNSFGTSNGLTLAKINTSQPAVIPAAFQDGKFASVAGPITGRFYTGGSQDENNISASGYYKFHDVRVGIKSGSQSDFVYKNGTDSNVFFYLYTGGLPADITTSVPSAVVSNPTLVRTKLSVIYKSLSGCPYIQSVEYNNTFSSEASNLFEPAYDSVTVLQHDISTNQWDSIDSSQTITPVAVATDSNGVDTSVANSRGVLSADKSTLRADGDIPHRTDIAFLSSSISMSIAIDSGISTTVQTKSAQAALTYTNTFRSRGRNWKNAVTPNTDTTLAFYNAALFTANSVTNLGSKVFTSDSGSMAIHAYQQGYDGGSLSGTTEQFSGEDFRIQLNNNVVSFSGDAFVQTFNINRSPSVIGDYDLQVKPGFLVDPGNTNGYWFPNGYGSGTYKYYIRRFQTSGTKTQLTVNVGHTLQAWNSTNNGISVAILFKSSADTNYTRARIYDPTATSDNDIETNISTDNHKNPFTDAIDLYGNTGGSIASTTYTMPLRNIDGMTLDNTNNEYYLIIRYKGNPSPVTQITVGY